MSKLSFKSMLSTVSKSMTVNSNENNTLQLKLMKYCETSPPKSYNDRAEVIECASSVPECPESILRTGRTHQNRHVTFSFYDEPVENDTKDESSSQQTISSNLSKTISSKFQSIKNRSRKKKSNKSTEDINIADSDNLNHEDAKQKNQKKSFIKSLKKSFNFSLFIRKCKRKLSKDSMTDKSVDQLEVASAYASAIEYITDEEKLKRRKEVPWRRASITFKRQKVEDWLNLHQDRLVDKLSDPIDVELNFDADTITNCNKSNSSLNQMCIGNHHKLRKDKPNKKGKKGDEKFPRSLDEYIKQKNDRAIEKESKRMKRNDGMLSDVCRRKCIELNTNFRCQTKKLVK